MSYSIELTPQAEADIEKHKKAGNRKVLVRIDKLFDELRENPKTGTGKPELLKHYSTPTWSRRLTGKHRIVYRIEQHKVVVLVLSIWGHYSDK